MVLSTSHLTHSLESVCKLVSFVALILSHVCIVVTSELALVRFALSSYNMYLVSIAVV